MFDDGVVGGGGWKTVCRLPERSALGSAFLCLSNRYMFLLYAGFRNIDLEPRSERGVAVIYPRPEVAGPVEIL